MTKEKWLEELVRMVETEGILIGTFSLHKELNGENPAPCGDYEFTSIVLDLGTVNRGETDEAVVRVGCTASYKWPWMRPFVEWITVDFYVYGDGGAWRRYTHLVVGDVLKRCITQPLLDKIEEWWDEEVGLSEVPILTEGDTDTESDTDSWKDK